MFKTPLDPIVALLLLSPTVCVCIFVNFVSEYVKWAKIIEDLLSDIFSPVSVEQINGEMDKHEKFGFITLFTDFLRMVGYDPCVLVVTSAANTLFQEWGCNARVLGMIGRYVICTSWIMFVKRALSIFLPSTRQSNKPSEATMGINAVIPSLSPDRQPIRAERIPTT